VTGRAAQKAESIKLVVLDVDGVMTDGTLTYASTAESESKSFNVKDGLGIKLLQRQGIQVAIITGRHSEAVERRAQELEIKMLVQGREDKGAALRELLDSIALDPAAAAYMGDDLPDLAALKLAGLATCPCDATEAVLRQADWVAPEAGGRGAVRALCDFILTAQGHLPAAYETFQ
jgi:3-deoxy-D-manno-octulosonate 8-phosphate phosphatase (KDO 8-P phosphatase)